MKKVDINIFSENYQDHYGHKKMKVPRLGAIKKLFGKKKFEVVGLKKSNGTVTMFVKEL